MLYCKKKRRVLLLSSWLHQWCLLRSLALGHAGPQEDFETVALSTTPHLLGWKLEEFTNHINLESEKEKENSLAFLDPNQLS